MQPRLTRSRTDKVIGGVCGGVGEYFAIDPVIVRLIFVVLVLSTGVALLAYPILWAVMPQGQASPQQTPNTGQTVSLRVDEAAQAQYVPPQQADRSDRWRNTLGVLLVGVGLFLLADQLGLQLAFVWPLLIVAGGIWLLRRRP